MTKNLLSKNPQNDKFPVFGNPNAKEDGSFLRAVFGNQKRVSGVLSSIKTRYLSKVKKEIQENPILSPQKTRAAESNSPLRKKRTLRNENKNLLSSINSVWDKHRHMENASPRNFREASKSPENFLSLNLLEGEQEAQPQKIKRKMSPSRDDTATVIAFQSSEIVVQPRYMANKGSMCTCELWNGKDVLRVAKKFQSKIIDATQMPVGDMGKAYIGLYKPQKFTTERVLVKMLTEHKHGMDVAFTDQLRGEVIEKRRAPRNKKSKSVMTNPLLQKEQQVDLNASISKDLNGEEEPASPQEEEQQSAEASKAHVFVTSRTMDVPEKPSFLEKIQQYRKWVEECKKKEEEQKEKSNKKKEKEKEKEKEEQEQEQEQEEEEEQTTMDQSPVAVNVEPSQEEKEKSEEKTETPLINLINMNEEESPSQSAEVENVKQKRRASKSKSFSRYKPVDPTSEYSREREKFRILLPTIERKWPKHMLYKLNSERIEKSRNEVQKSSEFRQQTDFSAVETQKSLAKEKDAFQAAYKDFMVKSMEKMSAIQTVCKESSQDNKKMRKDMIKTGQNVNKSLENIGKKTNLKRYDFD